MNRLCSFLIAMQLSIFPIIGNTAAPDDISNNQRAWFDGSDINANGDYTDNPANSNYIARWDDKSGSANHISGTGTQHPRYVHNSPVSGRHGVVFDGIDNQLTDGDDIWTGAVDHAESFIFATTDRVQNSSIFSSTDNNYNRLSTHLPWGSNLSFYDHGRCCTNPARLYGPLPISLNTGFSWHFIGNPTQQAVVRDGTP